MFITRVFNCLHSRYNSAQVFYNTYFYTNQLTQSKFSLIKNFSDFLKFDFEKNFWNFKRGAASVADSTSEICLLEEGPTNTVCGVGGVGGRI